MTENKKHFNTLKPLFVQGISFSLCFFAFQLTEFTINDRAEILLGAKRVNLVYAIGIACTAVGFLSFSLLRKVFEGEYVRKMIVCMAGILSVFSSTTLLITENHILFLLCSFLALLCYGNIGGNIYYHFAMYFAKSKYAGRVIGIGMGIAVLLQFIVQNLFVANVAFIVSILTSVSFMIYYVVNPPKDWMFENPLPYSAENKTNRKEAMILILAVVLMSLVVGLIDGVVVAKHAQGSGSVSSNVRLFYAGSLVIAGWIADLKSRKYLALITVCTLFLSTVSTAFISGEGSFFWATAFMYLYCGFYILFLTVSFTDLAPKTKAPTFWASIGRILRSLSAAVTAIPMVWLYERFGSIALVIGSCFLSTLTLIVLFPLISKSFVQQLPPPKSDETKELSREEKFIRYAETCGLTPREREVFWELITTEDDTQMIAERLYISRRMLQKYITVLYEKTGTKTRAGLVAHFMDFNS